MIICRKVVRHMIGKVTKGYCITHRKFCFDFDEEKTQEKQTKHLTKRKPMKNYKNPQGRTDKEDSKFTNGINLMYIRI